MKYYLKDRMYLDGRNWVEVSKQSFVLAERVEGFNAPVGECATHGFVGLKRWEGRVEWR